MVSNHSSWFRPNLLMLFASAIVFAFPTFTFLEQTAHAENNTVEKQRPNIVLILCDDLGYGDVQCLNPLHGKIKTPNIDQLAKDGMTFTDAHSGSSVCTPTRYGLLTGRYSWRTKLQKGVVQGFAPCLIDKDRPTVASFLKSHQYETGIIGKWHLNCRFVDPKSGKDYSQKEHKSTAPIGALIPDGPVHRGFDYFHGIHHARSMKSIIENDKVIEFDEVVNFLPRLTQKSVEFIETRAKPENKEKPFFLYVPLGSPHTPIVPSPDWVGKSGLGKYGDFVMQTDHAVGEICRALEKGKLSENTLVIFSSDNGCSKAADIPSLAKKGHRVSANLRGSKADIWDGGHRVPFIVRWPNRVKEQSNCDQTICLTDMFATVGEILEETVPANSCEDSVSFVPALYGKKIESTRKAIIHHSFSGHFAIRSGPWKLLLARASGGWSSPKENNPGEDATKGQLYEMNSDIGEKKNLYLEKPEVANELLALLKKYVADGRSTPGIDSKNDVPNRSIILWKSERAKPNRKGNKKKNK